MIRHLRRTRPLTTTTRTFSTNNQNDASSNPFTLLANFLFPSNPPTLAFDTIPSTLPTTTSSSQNNDSSSTILQDIFDSAILMAVPKQRVTRSKKRIKNYRKRIVADVKHVQECELCGGKKLQHILCECVVNDTSWKQFRDPNDWLNAGTMHPDDMQDARLEEIDQKLKELKE